MLIFDELEYTDDKTGRVIVRIIPKFIPPAPTANGKITFAFWEYWKDTENKADAILNAKKNAREVIKSWNLENI
jgi:hypothetical protein